MLPSELKLIKYILVVEMKNSGFGLSRRDMKCFVYQLAKKNNIEHSFSQDKESTGRTWFSQNQE